jgi:eukaryotic-like serine/threonine-protein kinase
VTPERRRQIEELFEAALDMPEAERGNWLEVRCGGDAELLRKVKALLAASDRTAGFLEKDVRAAARSVLEDPPSDRRIGAYRVVRELGRGGMGVVYLAERDDGQFRRQVAIKLLRSSPEADELHHRFLTERQILASLGHPNIAQLLDGGVTDGQLPYLVMEYVDGLPITVHCNRHRLGIDERLLLFQDACAAVHHAHQSLILHRDLKPSNILVTESGQVKLLDFGIAKLLDPDALLHPVPLTRTGLRPMTPQYASPEQVNGEPLTTASDVYALGVVLYEMLTGRPPYRFPQAALHEMLAAVSHEQPERPSTRVLQERAPVEGDEPAWAALSTTLDRVSRRLRGDLDAIVLTALRKEPERRYGSVEQMAADIQRHRAGHPIIARRDSGGYRLRKFASRHRWSLAAAGVLLVLLFSYAVTITVQNRRIRDALAQSVVDNSRAAQMATLLISMFERGGEGDPASDSAAAQLLERRLQRAEGMFLQPRERVRMLAALARIHRHLGDFSRAAALLEESLELQRTVADDRYADESETRIRLAEAFRNLNRRVEAESLLRRQIAEDRGRLGGDHPRVAWGLNELFYVLEEKGDYDGAESVAREALAIRKRLFGLDHVDVASSTTDLGLLLRRRGRLREAEPLYRQALEMNRQFYDPDSWQVAETLNGLGLLLVDLGRPQDAEPILREALERYRRIYGDRHPSVSVAMNSLARALSEQGQDAEPERLFTESLAIRRAAYGPTHPRTATALHALGTHHLERRDYVRAEAPVREALELWRRAFGDEHPDVARGRAARGRLLLETGKLDSAEADLRAGLRIQETALGAGHPQTAEIVHHLGVLLSRRGSFAEAESLFLRAQAVYEEQLASGDRRTSRLRSDLAALYTAWARPGEAKRYR